jgi:uncharacterized phage protein (TIGR02218 family)
MKAITPALSSLFATGAANYSQLFQFNLAQGGSLYYTSGDADILIPTYNYYTDEAGQNIYTDEAGLNAYTVESAVNYQLYQCERTSGIGLDRKDNKAKMHQAIGLTTDQLIFDMIPGSSQINGAPFLTCVREGVFDGAELIYSAAFWPADSGYSRQVIPTGTIQKYVGRVGEVDASRNLATFTINSYLELLDQNMPRNLFSAGCVNTLYDASCTLNAANFTSSGTALNGSLNWVISSAVPNPSPYSYNLGVVTFTSGANNGVSRTVKSFSSGTIQLIAPFPSVPANGDTFNISAGCPKLQSYCAVGMNNLSNFRGFPFIPAQESAG